MRCIIVEDEPMALLLIESYVSKTPYLELIAKFDNAFDVLHFFAEGNTAELIFLDIQMPEFSGIDLSKKLPPETKIIFTTAFEQYAIEGYKFNTIGYLLKPFSYSEFLEATDKAQQQKLSIPIQKNEQCEYIFVKSEYKQLKIMLDEIRYIEGLKDYVKIHLTSQNTPILTLLSLKKLTEELPSNKFMRVHRSFIVALDKIEIIERNQIIFGKQRISIANQYKDDFDAFIAKRSL